MISRSKRWWLAHVSNEAEAIIGAGTSPSDGGYMVYKPTFGDKVARLLGYKFELGDEPPRHEELTQGWAKTVTRLQFTWLGRLRLLFGGRLKIEMTHYTDGHFDTMQTRTDLRMLAPWERDHG